MKKRVIALSKWRGLAENSHEGSYWDDRNAVYLNWHVG